jgi:hypothetical protein
MAQDVTERTPLRRFCKAGMSSQESPGAGSPYLRTHGGISIVNSRTVRRIRISRMDQGELSR